MLKKLYLASSDYSSFEIPRKIRRYKKIILDNRNVLVIDLTEPLIGQEYEWGGEDITRFYLVNRHVGCNFDALDEFPIHVYVLIPKGPHLPPPSTLKDLDNIAWACLFDSKKTQRNT